MDEVASKKRAGPISPDSSCDRDEMQAYRPGAQDAGCRLQGPGPRAQRGRFIRVTDQNHPALAPRSLSLLGTKSSSWLRLERPTVVGFPLGTKAPMHALTSGQKSDDGIRFDGQLKSPSEPRIPVDVEALPVVAVTDERHSNVAVNFIRRAEMNHASRISVAHRL